MNPVLHLDARLATGPVRGGISTRLGFPYNDAKDPEPTRVEARQILATALGTEPARLAWCHQVHGARVRAATKGGLQGDGDALFTTARGLYVLISVADCCPVLVWNRDVVAAAHAGWRGMVGGVLEATVRSLSDQGANVEKLNAWIGPSIGVDRFEVGPEVAEQFDPRFVRQPRPPQQPKPHVDLKLAARSRLADTGLDPARIAASDHCTFEHHGLYWSYRRDGGICGRHIAYAGLVP